MPSLPSRRYFLFFLFLLFLAAALEAPTVPAQGGAASPFSVSPQQMLQGVDPQTLECRISTAMAPGPLAVGPQDAATANRGLAAGGCSPLRNAVNNRYDPRVGGSVVK